MTLSEELAWRGFVNQTTLPKISDLDKTKFTFYWGVDPSAPSMTVGNLATAMMVRHFIKYGHKAVLLVGGATGMIGDPDGKKQERELKSIEEISANKAAIVNQYKRLYSSQKFEIVDNYDWFKDIKYLEFLRDIGKHVPVSQMLQREFVQNRLGKEGSGISYAEFSYALIQGYDFLHLHKNHAVNMQVCGADQWGNSIAGVDLIRRITGGEVHVWSAPLVIDNATGIKFGKSETGAVWLDAKLTSAYDFYQFWFNTADQSVENYLKIFTLITPDELSQLLADQKDDPSGRPAQKRLAYEVTTIVHTKDVADSIKRASEVLFGSKPINVLKADDWSVVNEALKEVSFQKGDGIVELLVKGGLAGSNTEARRLMLSGAVYINNIQKSAEDSKINKSDIINGRLILRKGRSSQILVKL